MVRGKLISLHTGNCIRGVFDKHTITVVHSIRTYDHTFGFTVNAVQSTVKLKKNTTIAAITIIIQQLNTSSSIIYRQA